MVNYGIIKVRYDFHFSDGKRLMFDESPELASDLEWMLQSGRGNDQAILKALVQEQYERIYYQVLAALVYPEEARRIADETLVTALLQVHRYASQGNLPAWLDGIAGEQCRKRQAELRSLGVLNSRLIQSMLQRWPPKSLAPEDLERAVQRIRSRVQARRNTRRWGAGIQELLLAGVAILLVFALVQAANIFTFPFTSQPVTTHNPPGMISQPLGSPFATPEAQSAREPHALSPSTNSSLEIPPQEPLNLQSSHEDIWRRLLLSRFLWHTLWANVNIFLYGPEGYIGPPQAEHHQIWIEQDQRALVISGPLSDNPEKVHRITATSPYPGLTGFLQGVYDFSRLGSQLPWLYLSEKTIFSSPYILNFFFISHLDWPPRLEHFQVVGTETSNGRPAVVVDQMKRSSGQREARLWLDTNTGLILREQYFAPDNPNKVVLEAIVSGIAFDQPFPAWLFNEDDSQILNESYARYFDGEPLRPPAQETPDPALSYYLQASLPIIPPPEEFVPSQGRLTFQYAGRASGDHPQDTLLHVFSDQYYLGDISLPDPFKTTCARSPDGRRIAFSTLSILDGLPSGIVTWFDVSDLSLTELSFPDILVTRFAFAPDGRWLAVAGISKDGGSGRIYLVDVDSQERIQLPEVQQVWSLAWSPDGEQLAALQWPSFRQASNYIVQILVYNMRTRMLKRHQATANLDWGTTNVQIPLDSWQASLPLPMGGLEACAAIPQMLDLNPGYYPYLSDQR